MPTRRRIESFDLQPGRVLAGRYHVEARLGGGWEGEVYRVREVKTGVQRAAKLFFPHRNEKDRAMLFYATKLDRLRRCPIVIQYHHSETVRFRGEQVTCLISEFVEGELLDRFIARQPGKRLQPFEALHLLHALTTGLEQIHTAGEYHGDLHGGNVLVRRIGIDFDAKLVDFYPSGTAKRDGMREDVADLARLLYDAVGGQRHYRTQPPEIKHICCGLKRSMVVQRFPTARKLREHLETFQWESR